MQNNLVRYLELMEGQQKSDFVIEVRVLNGYFKKQWGKGRNGVRGKSLRTVFQNSKGFSSAQAEVAKIIEDTYGTKIN